jgi:two-component system nitrogen regulation sensor histidine kinase NtrY
VTRPPDDREKKRNCHYRAVLLLLVVGRLSRSGSASRTSRSPQRRGIALFNLNLIVFLLLLILLFRNLVKLWFERRHKVLGSRFKTKLVVAFLSLALAPAILIFLIASNLINTSIEGWFQIQVERPLDESMRVAQTFYERVQDEAVRHGQYVARTLTREGLLTEDRREDLIEFLQEQAEQYGLAGIAATARRPRSCT